MTSIPGLSAPSWQQKPRLPGRRIGEQLQLDTGAPARAGDEADMGDLEIFPARVDGWRLLHLPPPGPRGRKRPVGGSGQEGATFPFPEAPRPNIFPETNRHKHRWHQDPKPLCASKEHGKSTRSAGQKPHGNRPLSVGRS